MSFSHHERAEFLENAGWDGCLLSPVGEDWSQRKYFRIEKGCRTAILVHTVSDDDPQATAGHKLCDFVRIGKALSEINISVPQVYAHDLHHGLMLVEDFGTQDFADLIDRGGLQRADLYHLATKCLIHMYRNTPDVFIAAPDYYSSHIHEGRRRVVDWYLPAIRRESNEDGLTEDYLSLWREIESGLPPVVKRFQHADFHPGNLIYLPEREGIRQVGLIDFQGGVMGPAPYDLVNLLEDARRMVPDDIREECLYYFLSVLEEKDRESFLAWYPVLAAQFHFRVIGQAIRLAVRSDITRLLGLMPVLCAHIRRDLQNPLLMPMKIWFDDQGISFDPDQVINLQGLSSLIRPDAF